MLCSSPPFSIFIISGRYDITSGWKAATNSASDVDVLPNTGPIFDHTSGLADGKHSYLVTSSNGDVLVSPQVDLSGDHCMEVRMVSLFSRSFTRD